MIFSQLSMQMVCAFFLVVITTTAVGSPLDVSSNETVLELSSNVVPSRRAHLEKYGHLISKRSTFPNCPDVEYPDYGYSVCANINTISIICASDVEYNVSRTYSQSCEYQAICVDHTNAQGENQATCVDPQAYLPCYLKQDDGSICSDDIKYTDTGKSLALGMSAYDAANGNPISMGNLRTLKNGGELSRNTNMYNYSVRVDNYDGSVIKYCYGAGSDPNVNVVGTGFVLS